MSVVKWFKKIETAQAQTAKAKRDAPWAPLDPFDLDVLPRGGEFADRLRNRLLLAYFWLARLVWRFPPLPLFWDVVCVSRAADVRAVLSDADTYGVVYGPEMVELAGGHNFMLGMDGQGHCAQRRLAEDVWLRPGDSARIIADTRRVAKALIAASGGSINVMSDLITRVAAETCASYFGFDIVSPDEFADWSLSLSNLLFADAEGKQLDRDLALNGAARLRAVIEQALAASRADPHPRGDTLIDRLAHHPHRPSDGEIVALLVGMVVGFIPTTTLGAGRALEELLRRPSALSTARVAVESRNDTALKDIIHELLRLNPALQPGQWRCLRKDATLGGRRLRKGQVLMVATMSALRDPAAFPAPGQFRPGRDQNPMLAFGSGPHVCMGTDIAVAQITEIFRQLLLQPNLRPCPGKAGEIEWVGPFPRTLQMRFDGPAAVLEPTLITICAPVRDGVSKASLNAMIAALGRPAAARAPIRAALDATGVVHFASMSVVAAGTRARPADYLLFELSVDGAQDAALQAIARHAHKELEPIFDVALAGGGSLYERMRRHALKLAPTPWLLGRAATGLAFNGLTEFPVAEVGVQAELAAFARRTLHFYLREHIGLDATPWRALDFVRRLIRGDVRLQQRATEMQNAGRKAAAAELRALIKGGPAFADFLIRPTQRPLKFAEWTAGEPWDLSKWIAVVFKSKAGPALAGGLLAVLIAFLAMNVIGLRPAGPPAAPTGLGQFVQALVAVIRLAFLAWSWLIGLLGVLAVSLVSAFFFEVAVVGGAGWLLRGRFLHDEKIDPTDDQAPPLATIEAAARNEDYPGYAQNHFMAVTQLKPGLLRSWTLALALWGVKLSLGQFRPGFVVTMGTIHFARWFRIPNTGKLIFLSNYDGSWESYLEDFIMRAHPGQTAVWSNGVGFPRTENLTDKGAEDGDRFKRWVRRQQQVAPFWYSRFPDLTTQQIRNNALIHYGLMRAANDTAARAWLGCFGSMQRPLQTLESEQVQTLMFAGMADLPYGACVLVKLPPTPAQRRAWLEAIMPDKNGSAQVQPICFGDVPRDPRGRAGAAFLAFSGDGLRTLGLPPSEAPDGLGSFPGAFKMGMAGRARILGDSGESSPRGWRWSDEQVDAAMLIFGPQGADGEPREAPRDRLLADHLALLRTHGGAVVGAPILTAPVENFDTEYRREHFGFRDGISQPIIRGTQRSNQHALLRDVVEPGEFIFGYPNNLGYLPPSPKVRAESDIARNLPLPIAAEAVGAGGGLTSDFPNFGALDLAGAARDFGRNGAFLVVRQLAQDVERFHQFARDKAAEIRREYPDLDWVIGGEVNAEWIAAKMVGRWRDGTPLAGPAAAGVRPGPPARSRGGTPSNDFAFGADDPSGLRCPLGAHVRRANPRDGLDPGDPAGQDVTNRHRLLRRGRSYDTGEEKGLLFVALCADIERQFEFVQQTWIASPAFNGLVDEPDPLLAPGAAAQRVFTIPTVAGPLVLKDLQNFVTVKGGGYFFLPSRAALGYLRDLVPPRPAATSARAAATPVARAAAGARRRRPRAVAPASAE